MRPTTEGGAVVEGRKEKGVADERNRNKVLRDFGNLANIKVRYYYDSLKKFGALLLAKAQRAAPVENNKVSANVSGPLPVANTVAVTKRVVPKPDQKKINVKPKPEKAIDNEATPDKEIQKDKKKGGNENSKKKLQAESCITNNLKEQIIDIDAGDVDNELAVVDYIDDLYKFYKLIENKNRPRDYIDSQPEINERSRATLVNWLMKVNTKLDLSLETLYLTINIIDRFLAVKTVRLWQLQLVGISAMLMASKYEEICAPEVYDFVCFTAYTHEEILVMEKTILVKLEWTLSVPTPLVFLVRFIKASVSDQEMEYMAHFLSELGLMHYATLMYCPSMVAAAAVFAARCTLNKAPLWNETLQFHTGYSQEQLTECARLLVSFHSMVGNDELEVVYRKYSDPQKGAVAMFPPAKNLLPESSVSQ